MERFESLPDNLKTALTSEGVDASIQGVAKKHLLHIDQVAELADETGLVMLGFTKTDEYINNLKERLGIPQQKAAEIAKDIDEVVLRPIKSSLVGMSETAEAPEETLDREEVMRELHEHLENDDKHLAIDNKQLIDNSQPTTKNPEPAVPTTAVSAPITTASAPVNIVDKKLGETVKTPKEETIIDRTSSRYGSQDPYREPIE